MNNRFPQPEPDPAPKNSGAGEPDTDIDMVKECLTGPYGLLDPAPPPYDMADANTSWLWIKTVLAKIGLTVVVIEGNFGDWPTLEAGLFGDIIGGRLEELQLGMFDAAKWGPTTRWFFNVPTAKLAEALQWLKKVLQEADLLDKAKIGYADPEGEIWRTVHPGFEIKP